MKQLLLRSFVLLVVWVMVCTTSNNNIQDSIVVVIINQKLPQHVNAARQLASDVKTQAQDISLTCVVHVASDDWPKVPAWTYFPLLERIHEQHGDNSSWVVIIEENTSVQLDKLVKVLHEFDSSQMVFLGHGVHDGAPTIIHHFSLVNQRRLFFYPDIRAGMVLSTALVSKLAEKWDDPGSAPTIDFTIDAPYEFATFVKSAGTSLTDHESFCIEKRFRCGITFTLAKYCGDTVKTNEIHFAIKTYSEFHNERLPVVQETWLPDATNYAFYSDMEDEVFKTVTLGVPNTERGHCGKTFAIMKRAAKLSQMQWLAVVDDDTLISVPRLQSLLSCYDPHDRIAIGERYGFSMTTAHGYEYITGGGGMIFSKTLVKTIIASCRCPSIDAPDDMYIGVCLRTLGVPIIHSSSFHQARPMDYPPSLLQGDAPISFHKHWMLDPRHVYKQWLSELPSEVHEEL